MKLINQIILAALLAPAISYAAPTLPNPDALIEQGQSDRDQLLKQILNLQYNVPELRDPETFNSYFMTLDKLKELSVKTDLESHYPGIVEKLGLLMVSNGMRWLDLTSADTAKVVYYVKWMDADATARYLGLVEYKMTMNLSIGQIETLTRNVEAILPMIDKKAASIPYVLLGYRSLISDSAVKLLKQFSNSDEKTLELISRIRLSSSLAEYLDFLNQSIYSLNKESAQSSHALLLKLSALYRQSHNLNDQVPTWLLTGIADSTSEVIMKMVRLEVKFKNGQLESLLPLLPQRHLKSLAMQWMNLNKVPRANYIEEYMRVSALFAEALYKSNLGQEGSDFQKWMSKSIAPVYAQKLSLEGTYEVTNAKGQKFFLTIAVAKENMLIAGLSTPTQNVRKMFYNVTYDARKQAFVGTERDADTSGKQNLAIEIKVNGENVTVIDSFVKNGLSELKGKKSQSYPSTDLTDEPSGSDVTGVYEGDLQLPSGKAIKGRLIITSTNGYTVGRFDSDTIFTEFNIGADQQNGQLILTTGERGPQTAWLQLRGQITKDGFKGFVILGGVGKSTKETLLKKIQ